MSITRFKLFILGYKSGQIFTKKFGERSFFGRSMEARRCKAKGRVAVCLSVCDIPDYTLLTVIIRPRVSHVVTRRKIFVYNGTGVVELKITVPTVWLNQLVWTFQKLNSAYWRLQISRFSQWKYFSIRREDFLVGHTDDADWDARDTLFGRSEPGGRVAWSSYKILTF